jgi:hypothetical protein
MPQSLKIEVAGAGSVSLVRSVPVGQARLRFIYAPGAGSNLDDPFGNYCAERLPGEGIECWRFQFPYMEAKRRAPDRRPVLEATWSSVIQAAADSDLPVVVGGRSMGGRIASQVVAQGTHAAALVLFAYPLHPPGRPERRRDQHLESITIPTLLCSGTRDTFASPEELEAARSLFPDASLTLLAGADHGFSTLKSSGRDRDDVWAEAVQALLDFVNPRLG